MAILGANYPFALADASPISLYDDFITMRPPTPSDGFDRMRLRDTNDRQRVMLAIESIAGNTTDKYGYGVWLKKIGNPVGGTVWLEWGFSDSPTEVPEAFTSSAITFPVHNLSQHFQFQYFSDVVKETATIDKQYMWVALAGSFSIDDQNHVAVGSTLVRPPEGDPPAGFLQWDGVDWLSSGSDVYATGIGSPALEAQRNVGQVFYVNRNLRLSRIRLQLKKTGSPTGTFWLEIKPVMDYQSVVHFWEPEYPVSYYDTGSSSYLTHPNQNVLAISNSVNFSELTSSPTLVDFVFDGALTLQMGMHYAFILRTSATLTDSANLDVYADLTNSGYSDGMIVSQDVALQTAGGGYRMTAGDLVFEVYYDEATLLREQIENIGLPPNNCGDLNTWLQSFVNVLVDYFPQVIPEAYGGTGESHYAKGDLLYAPSDDNLARLPASAVAGTVLTMQASGLPAWLKGSGQVLERFWNRTGAQLDLGDAVIFDTQTVTPPGAIKGHSNLFYDTPAFAGVLVEPIANNAQGLVCTSGIVQVRLSGTCVNGDGLMLAGVSKRVMAIGNNVPAQLRALQAGSDGQLIWAYVQREVFTEPTGKLLFWPSALPTLPIGYLAANGQGVSRSVFARLFAVYGTTFGAGNGTTTFNLPDMRGRVPMGMDNMGFGMGAADRVTDAAADLVGGVLGAALHTLTTPEIPAHAHIEQVALNPGPGVTPARYRSGNGVATESVLTNNVAIGGGAAAFSNLPTQNAGGGGAHNNMQPSMAGLWLVQYL